MTAEQYIQHLQLQPHPEGGYFKETYRSPGKITVSCLPKSFSGDRNYSTAIYYLLQKGEFSGFHKINSDECWHFYAGGALLVHVIKKSGAYNCIRLGNKILENDVFQFVVPAQAWFAAEPAAGSTFSLVGCTVAPGFDFSDFEMANKTSFLQQFPQHQNLINRLCR